MGTYGTATGIVLWFNPDSGYGELLNLVDGDSVLSLSGPNMSLTGTLAVATGGVITWAGGKGRADNTGIEHVEDALNYWEVKPDSDSFLRVFTTDSHNAIHARSATGNYGAIAAENTAVANAVGLLAQTISGTDGIGVWGYSTSTLANPDAVGVKGEATYGIGVWGKSYFSTGVAVKAEAAAGATALLIAGGIVDGGSQRYTSLANPSAATDAVNLQTGDLRYGRRWRHWLEA